MTCRHTTITIGQVQEAVATVFHLRREDLISPDRSRQVTRARHLAMHLSRELAGVYLWNPNGEWRLLRGVSLPRIGRAFARDHTSVMYACALIRRKCESDAGFAHLVAMLAREIEREARPEAFAEVAA